MGNLDQDPRQSRKFLPPEKLNQTHITEDFCSGVKILDIWLKQRALKNEAIDASRTYVVCVDHQVVGYYSLAVGSVHYDVAIRSVKRNMPNPVPVMVLGRLAVDQDWQGQGLGRGLLRDAILRTLQAAEIAAIKVMLVHAISEEAKAFYESAGFRPSNVEAMTLMITLEEATVSLSGSIL